MCTGVGEVVMDRSFWHRESSSLQDSVTFTVELETFPFSRLTYWIGCPGWNHRIVKEDSIVPLIPIVLHSFLLFLLYNMEFPTSLFFEWRSSEFSSSWSWLCQSATLGQLGHRVRLPLSDFCWDPLIFFTFLAALFAVYLDPSVAAYQIIPHELVRWSWSHRTLYLEMRFSSSLFSPQFALAVPQLSVLIIEVAQPIKLTGLANALSPFPHLESFTLEGDLEDIEIDNIAMIMIWWNIKITLVLSCSLDGHLKLQTFWTFDWKFRSPFPPTLSTH